MKPKSILTLLAGLFSAGLLLFATATASGLDEPPAASTLNDLEIAHIAYTSGIVDIRYAHLALAISENPEVRAFAETMIRDHSAVNEKALALLRQLNATPQDNPTSRQLSVEAAQIRKELVRLEGPAFDKRYAANELDYHLFVNDTVENQFIPAVENAEFKALLESALRTFKAHQQHVERLNRSLNPGSM